MVISEDSQLFDENAEVISNLRTCPFFEGLPDDLLEKIVPITELEDVDPGTEILKEGEINTKLYFLMEGTLGVYVEGELVTRLRREGDVIGEMSVISAKQVSATVVAMTPVTLLTIKATDFNQISGEDADTFQHTLYRIFAIILTEKLSITNEKAKEYERLNRELNEAKIELQKVNLQLERKVEERTQDLRKRTQQLEQSHRDIEKSHQELEEQNAELIAQQRKLEDLNQIKESTFHKLASLTEEHLTPLNSSLEVLLKSAAKDFQPVIRNAHTEVHEVSSILQSLSEAYTSEKAIQNKRVLLLESNKKQQIIARMALGGTGVALDIASTNEEGQSLLEANSYDIVVTDTEMIQLTQMARKKNPDLKLVFMTSSDIPDYLNYLKNYDYISNVVSRHGDDKLFTIKNIVTTVSKLVNQDFFGLEKYLSWGVDVQEHPVVSSTQRKDLIHSMEDYFTSIGLRSTIVHRASAVTEELLMNAIYDAPTRDGKPIYNHLSRQVPVDLKPEEQGKFRYACDGVLAAISVQDPFGALTRDIILTYLDSCYGGRAGSLNAEKGGAGMGLFQLIGTSDLVIFNVSPRVKTEVIALFNIDLKISKSIKYPSFHYFFQ